MDLSLISRRRWASPSISTRIVRLLDPQQSSSGNSSAQHCHFSQFKRLLLRRKRELEDEGDTWQHERGNLS
jgi:hypothetical protein